MAAYAAVISLSNTIDRLLNHNQISISPEQEQQLLSLLEHANSFEAFLEEFPDKFNNLEGRMRDLAHEAEDIIEYFMLDQVNSSHFQIKVNKILLENKIIHLKEYERKDSAGGWFRRFIHSLRRNNKQKEHADSVIRKAYMGGFEDLVIELKDSLRGEPSGLRGDEGGADSPAALSSSSTIHSEEYEGGADSPAALSSSSTIHSKGYEGGAAALATSSTAPPIRKHSTGGWFRRFIHPLRRNNKQKEHADSFIREDVIHSELQVIQIYGRDGIGKTTVARYLYHDPLIMEHFDICVWVKLSDWRDSILSSVLESLKEYTKVVKGQSDDEKVLEVYKILMGRRYLVVIDNIRRYEWNTVRRVFPDNHNGSRVMLISRFSLDEETITMKPSFKRYEMALLNEDKSWDLLKWKVFGDEECPSELENIGREIARCCKGWPVALAMIAGILSTTTRTCVSWKEWAEEYCDESGCYQHQIELEKVMEEIGLVAGEVREIKDSLSLGNDVQCGVASSAALISAAASSSGKVTSMKKNNIKQDMVQLDDSSSSSDQVKVASFAVLSSSSTTPHIHKDVMVGFEDYVSDLQNRLCGEPSKKLQVIPICGMGGIGKTTLARNLYHDPLIVSRFDIRIWVTISQDFSAQTILSSLLESLKEFDKGGLGQSDDEKVYKILFGRRYLVVMDDIWSSQAWDVVRRVFPDDGNGSLVMLTTRLSDVASYPDPSSKICEIPLLNEYESWNLLKKNVFGDEDCPSELQDIGKHIATSCKGLPLAIVVIASVLSTTMRKLVSWKVIAENVKSAQHDQIEEILYLSYVHLPQYLRPCFLYMGSFPEDHEIDVLKLIKLWIAEGFVKSPIDSDCFEEVAGEFLEELVKRNLVLVAKREWDGRIKRCGLHDLMRDLCIRESHDSKFFLNARDSNIGKESFVEKVRNVRRVSVDSSNVEFFSSLHGSTIRSIKCFRDPYSDGLDFLESVRLLRVLDAEFFEVHDFLTVVHLDELFHLRYLAIRSFDTFPLSRLQNLQTLVIRAQYGGSIKLNWCMSQLRHVYFHGTIEFEDPKETDCPLESLQTLCGSLSTYRETILKMIPNLKELRIDCSEGLPSDDGVCLYDLVHLRGLETLEIYAGFGRIEYYKITFPRMLKKLILAQCTLPWNDIFVSGSFPNLQVLKFIFFCTCVGGTWKTVEGALPVLEVLKISCSPDLENWETESSHFPRLKLLQIHYCGNLSGIPSDIGEIPTLQLIEVKEFKGCGRKSLIESLELIREEQEEMGNDTLQVVYSETNTVEYDDDDRDTWFPV